MPDVQNRYALPVLTDRTYRNPLRFDDGSLPTNPDPFVTRYRGRYYCVSSAHAGVQMSWSDDLVSWHLIGLVLEEPERREFWAPCLARINGTFYLYYSSRPAGSDDPHEEVLHVASSNAIEGPYRVERRFFDTFSIDPHVVRDPSGEWVMFYSTNEPTGLDGESAGTSILVDRLLSPTELAGEPRAIVIPSIDEEIFERNRFGSDRDWYTIEGASYFTHHGRAFLTYSGNAYVGEDYFIGYSSAELSGAVPALRWSKHPSELDHDPLVRRNTEVEGTGHNSIVAAPNLVDDWIAYHARDAADPIIPGTEQRVMRIDPLFYSADTLTTCAPSSVTQDAPAQPTVGERFEGHGTLPEGWTLVAGAAERTGDAVVASADGDLLVVHAHHTEAYVAEVWLQATRTDAGARAGIVPWFRDATTFIEACIDVATAQMMVRQHENGFTSLLGSWPVDTTALENWSLLRVERTFDTVSIWIDERAAGTFAVPSGPAAVGLRSIRTAAHFAAFTLTDHVALQGSTMRYLPRLFRADTRAILAEDGVASGSRRPVILVGDAPGVFVATTYELQLDASWSSVDLYPDHRGDDIHLSIHLDTHGYRIATSDGRVTTTIAEGAARNPRALSVRTQGVPGAVIVRVDDTTVRVPWSAATSGGSRRIDLVGARLRSLDQTSYLPYSHPSTTEKEPVKEQK
jgi:GH43 family beta-xylosidase